MRRAAGPLALLVLAAGLSLGAAEAILRWRAAALRPASWPCVYHEPDPRFGFRPGPVRSSAWRESTSPRPPRGRR